MYHLELRQFPHNLCRFNLTREQLHASVVDSWARDHWIELEGRKWSPDQARLTILEGPPIPTEQLTMGRGWRNAQRHGEDVTAAVLAAARSSRDKSTPTPVEEQAPDEGLLADSLGLELLAQLEGDGVPLVRAWRLARARLPERSAGECLSLAEQAVRSLLKARLIALIETGAGGGAGAGDEVALAREAGVQVGEGEVDAVLGAIDSWAEDGRGAVLMRRV